MPTTHTSTVNIERATLLCAMLQGKTVDFSKVINRAIQKVVTDNSKQGFPFLSLTIGLCMVASATASEWEPRCNMRNPITYDNPRYPIEDRPRSPTSPPRKNDGVLLREIATEF